jgi:iron complex outermembrane recepter protein
VGYYEQSLAAAPAVSVYQDEVAYSYPVMTKGALLDIDRVEILKGPQGTHYGQNATGGLINFIAAKPTDSFTAGVTDTYSRFNENKFDGFISGPLAPTLSARLAVSLDEGGAWQKSDTRDDTLGNKDVKIGRLLLDWQPVDNLKVSLNVNGWTDDSQSQANQLEGFRFLDPQFIAVGSTDNPAFYLPSQPYSQYPAHIQQVLANPIAPNNAQAADWVAGTHPRNHERYYQGALRLESALYDALGITSLTTFEKYTQSDQHDIAGVNIDALGGLFGGDIRTVSQELRFHGVLAGQRLEWLVGLNYEQDKSNEDENFSQYFTSASYLAGGSPESLVPIAPFMHFETLSAQKVDTYSAFANVEYRILSNLDVHAAIRYTKSEQDIGECTKAISDPGYLLFQGGLLGLLNGGPPETVVAGQCNTLLPRNAQGLVTLGAYNTTLDQDNIPWRVGVDWKLAPDDLPLAERAVARPQYCEEWGRFAGRSCRELHAAVLFGAHEDQRSGVDVRGKPADADSQIRGRRRHDTEGVFAVRQSRGGQENACPSSIQSQSNRHFGRLLRHSIFQAALRERDRRAAGGLSTILFRAVEILLREGRTHDTPAFALP